MTSDFLLEFITIEEKRLDALRGLHNRMTGASQSIDTPHRDAPAGTPPDPLAKSMADLVTPKQLGMIRALARNAHIDADEECFKVLRCKTDELSKKAASSFIDHLKSLETQVQNHSVRRA